MAHLHIDVPPQRLDTHAVLGIALSACHVPAKTATAVIIPITR
jgi:hypothetical protein